MSKTITYDDVLDGLVDTFAHPDEPFGQYIIDWDDYLFVVTDSEEYAGHATIGVYSPEGWAEGGEPLDPFLDLPYHRVVEELDNITDASDPLAAYRYLLKNTEH